MSAWTDSGFQIAAGITAVCTVGLLVGERSGDQRIKWAFKPVAAAGFIAAAIAVGAHTHPFGIGILVGLILSAVGDVLLIPRGAGKAFLGGLGAFLLAHVAYAVAFVVRGIDPTWTAIAAVPAALFGFVVHRWLAPDVKASMQRPVLAYIVVISAMVALAVGTYGAAGDVLVPVAAVMFLLSDVSVAMDRFKDAGFLNRAWGLPLYFGAQVVFAATAMP